jgi:lauroyl/myristoyl acyltransferase
MSIDLQQVINSPFAVNVVSFAGRIIPPGMGYSGCNLIAGWMAARRDSKLTRAVRANQWVIRGANLEKRALDLAVQETLRNNARDIYNLYHYIQNPEAVKRMIVLNPLARELLERPEFADRGLVIVGLHLSNFDLILQSIFRQGFKAMVLTIPDPQGGRRVEYEIRRRTGMNLIPASLGALRQAVNHLEQGGMVLTGIDRPVQHPKHRPRFFGCEASLPTHYVTLASKARVPIVVMAATQQADGKYHVMSSEPIEMEHDPDHGREILRNAEKVLKQAETFIRLAPQQWNVPLPVWPELLDTVPG